ncbi:MAG: SDR family oxidoreductase [Leptolyngbya sp. SIO4C1]|nr:SDR family oxidoreductase [Leptolyngbya sp. SIO4C1]
MTLTALITGASQGTGRATALYFAQRGYDIAIAARSADRLNQVADEIRSLGRQALAIPTDVSQPDQVAALVEKTLAALGSVDVLINTAGICLTGPVQSTTLEDWHQLVDTNFWGYVYTINALLPHLIERQQGAIVNVGSFGGKLPLPQMTAYCASKYAVTGLSESLQVELAQHNIHVALVHPGVINSSFMERAQFRGEGDQQARDRMANMLKSSWVSQPEDIAQAIWQAVVHKRSETVVGPATLATEAHRLFPGLTRWALRAAV